RSADHTGTVLRERHRGVACESGSGTALGCAADPGAGIPVTPREQEPSMQSTSRVLWRRATLLGTGLVLVLLSRVPATLAWNKAGHMVSGAIAYADLQHASPQTLARVLTLLKAHPYFEMTWAPRLSQSPRSPEEQDLYLFMLAARWPDDIRHDPAFHHGAWHYI